MKLSTFLSVLMIAAGGTVAQAEPLPIRSGDRIVLVGSTFFERDVRYGAIETLMTAHFREYDLSFRNLAWSGDTVWGEARASFDPVHIGYERLIGAVTAAEPDILILNYGNVESFEGAAGLDRFLQGYKKLLDDLNELDARTVLVSPLLQENLGPPLPDPTAHNADVKSYAAAIKKLAEERGHYFVDMTKQLSINNKVTDSPLTDNGLHFTEEGSWDAAAALVTGLGYDVSKPNLKDVAELRAAILEKNRLFFNKWRPQNETYITGFRAHEQGQHAAETPMYDPLVEAQEKRIAAARQALRGDAR